MTKPKGWVSTADPDWRRRPRIVLPNVDDLAARYRSGASALALATEAGVSVTGMMAALERAGVDLRRQTAERLLAAFWSKVEKHGGDGCWLWRAATNTHGYGHMRRDGRWWMSHRYAYELEHGPIAPGLDLCHRCDTPACVRPSHMFAGSRAENMGDARTKGRNARGQTHGCARLTETQVLDIRRRYDAGERHATLGVEYGLTYQTVWMLGTRRSWTHLPEQAAA